MKNILICFLLYFIVQDVCKTNQGYQYNGIDEVGNTYTVFSNTEYSKGDTIPIPHLNK